MIGILGPGIALMMCYHVVMPQRVGPKASLLFFGGVAKRSQEDYEDEVSALTPKQYLHDLSAQCHVNACIAASKYDNLEAAMMALFLGVIGWMPAMFLLYKR